MPKFIRLEETGRYCNFHLCLKGPVRLSLKRKGCFYLSVNAIPWTKHSAVPASYPVSFPQKAPDLYYSMRSKMGEEE